MTIQFRKSIRVSITVSDHVYQQLVFTSDQQGRSLSNYAAFLLESSILGVKDPDSGLEGHVLSAGVNAQSPLQPAAMFRR
jgi:hypothetical protein